MRKHILIMLCICLIILIGCDINRTNTSDKTTVLPDTETSNLANDNDNSDIESKDSLSANATDEKAFANDTIVSANPKLNRQFIEALYANYPDETTELADKLSNICQSDTKKALSYRSSLWRETYGKSYYVLKDEMSFHLTDKKTALENNILMLDAKDDNSVTLAFAGDICFEDGGAPTYRWNQEGIKGCFSKDLIKLMKNSDMFMANNEFTLSKRGAPTPNKTYTFRGNPSHIKWIKKMGVDVLSMANNHAYDYGEESFVDTYNTIKDNDILLVGGGMNIKDATTVKYVVVGGMKIALIAATQIENWGIVQTKGATSTSPGVLRCADSDEISRVVKMIKKAKKHADYVIAYPHWGIEYEEGLQIQEQSLAKAFAKAGADIILGGHPHCVQGVEYYGDTACCYSLSNFIFNSKSINLGIVTVDLINGNLKTIKYHPAKTEGGYTWLCKKGDANYNTIINTINSNSAENAYVTDNGVVKKK